MGVIVPVLRLAMLFLNIYDSYKTLKTPSPSHRNGGRPSARALTQRKRDMKGCLAVWIVWCCFLTYERLVEAFISIFVPFYDEFKIVVILFFIFTRARGAEPIFLHVLRPILKPYTPTLDLLLDFVCMLGDMLYALVKMPINSIKALLPAFMFCKGSSEPETSRKPLTLTEQPPSHMQGNSATFSLKVSERLHFQTTVGAPHVFSNGIDGLPTVSDLVTEETRHEIEEWREYPAFPSAYPPTPLLSATGLPTGVGYSVRHTMSDILDDTPKRQSGDRTLPRVQSKESEDTLVDVESEQDMDDEDEDEFNTTLMTPMPPRYLEIPSERESSVVSARHRSINVTTAGLGSLRNQSSSESISSATSETMSVTSAPMRGIRSQSNRPKYGEGLVNGQSRSGRYRKANGESDCGQEAKTVVRKRRTMTSPTRTTRPQFSRNTSVASKAQKSTTAARTNAHASKTYHKTGRTGLNLGPQVAADPPKYSRQNIVNSRRPPRSLLSDSE